MPVEAEFWQTEISKISHEKVAKLSLNGKGDDAYVKLANP